MSDKWVQGAFSKHPGKLHRRLDVPEGEKIPAAKLEKAEHSSDPSLRKEANLAATAKGFHHGGGSKSHGFGHSGGQRQGNHRASGHPGAHRIGRK